MGRTRSEDRTRDADRRGAQAVSRLHRRRDQGWRHGEPQGWRRRNAGCRRHGQGAPRADREADQDAQAGRAAAAVEDDEIDGDFDDVEVDEDWTTKKTWKTKTNLNWTRTARPSPRKTGNIWPPSAFRRTGWKSCRSRTRSAGEEYRQAHRARCDGEAIRRRRARATARRHPRRDQR